ncbi:hypothetical protein JTE90_012831 [Oedothorax gibbosus]|uniref:Uncharacterized protein n=1 Tax=Oedothorax gibbosus TaxID=931172 RepID=A0AAV6W0T2_9ARAC|nr:hypothetical protein JTE90_012831 [Oedothorax gibbosus]
MTSLGFLLTFLFGFSVGSSEFPNPQREWRMCGRTKASYICDPDFILERSEAERLDQIARDIRRVTACICPKCSKDDPGISVGIFVRRNISKESLSKYPTGNDVSEMLRRRWSLSPCDGDVTVVLVPQLNMSGYSLGPAVVPYLPYTIADRIMAECSGHFESEYYYQGLESILNSLGDAIVEGQRHHIGPSFIRNMALGIGLGFGVLLVLALVALALLHREQVKRRKSNCSNIYADPPGTNNRRPRSFNHEEHLDKLKRLEEEDDNSDEDQHLPHDLQLPVRYMRAYRQLSDVAEESGEDDVSKRNSSLSSSLCSPTPKGSVPVTEL